MLKIPHQINTPQNLLVLISKFRKVIGYEINTQKSVAYTNNEQSEKNT